MMKIKTLTAALLLWIMGLSACAPTPSPSPSPSPTATPAQAPADYFSLDPAKNLIDRFVGWGSQYNQNLYAALSLDYGITAENVGQLEEKVIALGSQHVRIFYDPDAEVKPVPNFGIVADPSFTSFRKVVKLAQDSGATVNITYWHHPEWRPGEMERFAQELKYLIVDLNYTCVQYVTVQNEANTAAYMTKDLYKGYLEQLDAACRALGIRHRLKFIGGDIVFDATWGNYPTLCREWLNFMGQNMNDILDGYSFHIYWNVWDFTDAVTLLGMARGYIEDMPEAQHKPLYISEYGVRGYRSDHETIGNPYFLGPGASEKWTKDAIPVSKMLINGYQHAMFNIEAAKLGYVGLARWDCYRARYDGTKFIGVGPITGEVFDVVYGYGEGQDLSMIAKGSEGYALRESYYQLALMTRAAKPGSTILGTREYTYSQRMLALQSSTGELSLFLYHKSKLAKEMYVKDLPQKTYYVYSWNKNGDGKITFDGTAIPDENGFIKAAVSPESFSVITSFQMDFTDINAFE